MRHGTKYARAPRKRLRTSQNTHFTKYVNRPHPKTLRKLAAALGVEITALLED